MCGCCLTFPTGDLACSPGMCPDWESNQQPFGSQAGIQSTQLHPPGLFVYLFIYFEEAVDSHGLIIHKNIKSYKMMFPSYSSSHSAQRRPFSIDSYY